jgi:general secretion pathway protein D
MKSLSSSIALALISLPFFAGCASVGPLAVTDPLRLPEPATHAGRSTTLAEANQNARAAMSSSEVPQRPDSGRNSATPSASPARPPLRDATISTNIESLALPAFINEAFGNQLGVNFQLDPAVAARSEVVTLRLPSGQSSASYYDLVVDVLRSYQVKVEWDGDLLRVTPETSSSGEAPIIVSGRGTPNVPSSHRPLFQLVELENVAAGNVSGWLRSAFDGQGLKIEDDLNRNAIVLVGKPALVAQAVEAIRVLDRPFMRGRFSARLEPAFVGASDLAKRISDVMLAQGYAVGTQIGPGSGTLLLPIESSNAVLVFAPTREILRYVQDWAVSIDAPGSESGGSNGLFYYMMRNTQAQDVAQVLTGLGSSTQSGDTAPALAPSSAQPAAAPPPASAAAVSGASTLLGGKLTVDGSRNALIFQGNANEWQRVLPLVRQMDQPARQVMVEVTIAEVTLRDGDNFGVNWAGTDSPGRFDGRFTFGTLSGSTTTPDSGSTGGGSGLTYLLNVGAETRARLTALAQDSRLSVLSTPRLMVKSGDEANIEIGDEVPTLTSTSVGPQQSGGTTTTLQSIQYRKTGILLNIKPTVYSDDRVDLEINQEVSDVNPDAAVEGISSPAIFNRSVTTSLTLKDGSSLLLGGLMSNRQTRSNSGIPALKDVPVLGNLFKSQTRSINRTELVLIITPYIVENDADATTITAAIRDQLELIELPPLDATRPTTDPDPINPPQH